MRTAGRHFIFLGTLIVGVFFFLFHAPTSAQFKSAHQRQVNAPQSINYQFTSVSQFSELNLKLAVDPGLTFGSNDEDELGDDFHFIFTSVPAINFVVSPLKREYLVPNLVGFSNLPDQPPQLIISV